jgi:hypothetical protein
VTVPSADSATQPRTINQDAKFLANH